MRIHAKLDTVQDQQRLESWVFQIARNLVVDYYRSNPNSTIPLDTSAGAVSTDSGNLNEEVLGWIPAAVKRLPENYREAVRLY